MSVIPNIVNVRKKAQQRLYFLRQLKRFNLSQEQLVIFYTAIFPPPRSSWSSSTPPYFSLPRLPPSQCDLAHQQNRTGPDCNEQSGLQRGSPGLTFPQSRTYTDLGSGKRLLKSLQTPHTTYLDFRQVSATKR
ncbi:hypothetical protein ILYODFUR_031505 [Ilyodon furcidens]|uniref:Alkylated DNA repair protein AlkB homologue 8 N-terminal domain-containing protein n=1 Tax=Ilyodon furcidens TaxID=33524 RepID=A0ABV0SQR8_9TELE